MTVLRWIPRAAAACALAGLAACGTQQAGGGDGGGQTAPASTLPATQPPVTTPTGKSVPPEPGSAVVVQGVIEKGVEPGCYVLTPDQGGRRYLVVTTTQPPLGVPVTVRGTTNPELVSYCQQGMPLQATRIERR